MTAIGNRTNDLIHRGQMQFVCREWGQQIKAINELRMKTGQPAV